MSRKTGRAALWLLGMCAVSLQATACAESDDVPVPGRAGLVKSSAASRADRRAYDGAPPVIPHSPFGAECSACHNERGQSVPNVGFAPPSPHPGTVFEGGTTRCRQCHVFRTTEDLFVSSGFVGLDQDLAAGDRATAGAPPRIPHRLLMRENCVACHDGPAAREEIRTDHPERDRCRQCHVPVETRSTFESAAEPSPDS